MSGSTATAGAQVENRGAPPRPGSRLRRLADLYASPGDRTPMGVGVAIGALALAGLLVLGPTSDLWLLACSGLLLYAVASIIRPLEVWRVLREPGRPRPPGTPGSVDDDPGDRTTDQVGPRPDDGVDPDQFGWLPTRRSDRP